MMALLNNFDPGAGECLETHRAVFQTLFAPGTFARFAQQVSNFAFADALAELQTAIQSREG